ncbi:Protein CBR-DYF-11 [Caenorhabditis briggsae]|uniref:Protein CBR-DYF-11 n=1 Tax=Caenorhabditis briggsae TaxID=6238 RepID=A8Y1F6_CAEBR|nr:Protein CBR-DYF-11 [Caenorhabditis briggsae]CAP38725.2 Protein CBR-DYF-11 [Caenorhabditis briggsae]
MASTTMEKTKKVLEKIIEKPKITIALLERPPFKFIVDIVSNVIEATGYLKNDFSKEEIQSAGKDKDSKSAFLEKLIKILDDGSLKNVKASKIMSGMEPVETNKENKENEKDEKKKKSSSKDRHKSSEKKEKKEKKSDDSKPKKSKLEKSEKEKTEKSEKVLVRQDSMITSNGDVNNHEELPDDGYDDKEDTLSIPVNEKSDEPVVAVEEETPPVLVKYTDMAIRPTTGAAGGRPMTSMGRPGTAASRPAPPKLKKKQIATMDATPQQQIELKSEIITDSGPILENAEDAFIMENEEDDLEKTPRIAADVINKEDRGALVQKIMETKAGIEDSRNTVDQMDEDSDKGITVEREKVRQLQEKLQDLTRLYNIISNLQREIVEMKEELSKARGRVLNNGKKIGIFISNV